MALGIDKRKNIDYTPNLLSFSLKKKKPNKNGDDQLKKDC